MWDEGWGMGDGEWESLLTLEAKLLRVRAGTYDCVAGRLEESPKCCLSCCHGGCHKLSNELSLSVRAGPREGGPWRGRAGSWRTRGGLRSQTQTDDLRAVFS